ncbi:MAG: hypothetical protein NTW26_07635 [bacterium]|nr:hypothetical protein [bacterium]
MTRKSQGAAKINSPAARPVKRATVLKRLLASRQAAASPLFSRWCMNMGRKKAAIAFSPSSRRKKYGRA